MQLINAANMVRGDILNSYMTQGSYTPKSLAKKTLKLGLFDSNKKEIYSELSIDEVAFNTQTFSQEGHDFHVHVLDREDIPIRYIVVETKQALLDRLNLQNRIWIILALSAVFISIIGYALSNLLLKPVREKIADMDRFIKDSAHELNTPIAVLRTSMDMLKRGKNPDKMLGYMSSSTKQISEAFNDLHFAVFSDIKDSMNTEFDLAELSKACVVFFEDIAAVKKITIEHDIDALPVFMDRSKAQKIINNLLSNAIKYSPRSSKVLLTLKGTILCMQDFGIGISEAEQKIIFKRFQRGTNNEGGLGIGLDIVTRICQEYDIKITLQSKLKEGSSFLLDFKNAKA